MNKQDFVFLFSHTVGIGVETILLSRLVELIKDYNYMSALQIYRPKTKWPNYLRVCGAGKFQNGMKRLPLIAWMTIQI